MQIRQAWGMTETSPLATMAWPPPGVPEERALGAARHAGPADVRCRGAHRRRRRQRAAATTARPSARSRFAGRGSPAPITATRDESKFDDGWLRTGDVGRIDAQGFVTLTDRAKDVIKSGGEWISSVELENHLIGAPRGARGRRRRGARRALAGAAAGRRRRQRGCRGHARSELREFLGDKVVRWWLPERWTFVDEVPRTSVGKYDKKTIRARYAEDAYEVIARDGAT